jgi:hypothetical protein
MADRERSTTMLLLTGAEVWEAIVKLGWVSGSYDPKTNRYCANADALAGLLNQVLGKCQNWLPNLVETEDAMREWEASTPREYVLRLYKFLNLYGYSVVGIDAAIEREVKRRTVKASDSTTKKTQP